MRPGSSSRCLKSRWPVTSCRIITTNDASSSSSSFCCCQGLKMSLYPDYFCFACSKREPIGSSTLKTCSKCGLAQYCNKECQIKGWTTHKKTCGILKKAFQRSEVATIWEFAEISQSYLPHLSSGSDSRTIENWKWFGDDSPFEKFEFESYFA